MADLLARLRMLRQATGETQAELGTAVGVGQQTIWGWESGRVKPDWQMLGALADHFQVSVDYLIGRTDDPKPPRPAASDAPNLTRWLRESVLAKRVSLRDVSQGARVPMAVLLEIHEGSATDVSPVHLRALARHFDVAEADVLRMVPPGQSPGVNDDILSAGIAADTARDLTDEERRQVEEVIRRIRRERRAPANGGEGGARA